MAVRIGPAPAAESYLSIPALLEAAARTGADAVHPGYGFLSERAAFARAVTDAGLVFIGPPADVIDAMGRKDRAREIAVAAGVPVVPGRRLERRPTWTTVAAEVGFPLLVKAAAGGGGKGMRIVRARGRARRRRRRRPARGGGRVRRRHHALRAVRRARPPHRGADPRRRARQRRPPPRARLLGAAPPPEGARGGAGDDDLRRPCATSSPRRPSRWPARSATSTPAPSSSWSPARTPSSSR